MVTTASTPPQRPQSRAEARAHEREKTQEQRAKDVAYTINHSLACTATDFLNPFINAATDGAIKGVGGCGHDHSKDYLRYYVRKQKEKAAKEAAKEAAKSGGASASAVPPAASPPAADALPPPAPEAKPPAEPPKSPSPSPNAPKEIKPLPVNPNARKGLGKANGAKKFGNIKLNAGANAAQQAKRILTPLEETLPELKGWAKYKAILEWSFSANHLKHWIVGEFLSDFGAVPLTIATQRWAPGMMHEIRNGIEWLMGGLFRAGTERATRKWAKKNGVEEGSDAFRDHQQRLYEHEMSHLPQAVVWTGFALAINIGYQMIMDKAGNLWSKTVAALSGMAVTAGLVVGARIAAPAAMNRFDDATSERFFLPATKAVGKLFGVDAKAVEALAQEKRDEERVWGDRVRHKPEAAQGLQRG